MVEVVPGLHLFLEICVLGAGGGPGSIEQGLAQLALDPLICRDAFDGGEEGDALGLLQRLLLVVVVSVWYLRLN